MRAAWLVLLLLLSTLPLPHVGAESTPGLTCPETVALVPGQATSVSFIQHGVDDATLSFGDLAEVEITDVVNTTDGDNRTWTGTFTAILDAHGATDHEVANQNLLQSPGRVLGLHP